MGNNDKKLTLTWLKILTFGQKRPYPKGGLAPTFFDDRSDVAIYPNQPTTLAVLLRFDKLAVFEGVNSPAVRRKLAVMLTDTADTTVFDIARTQIDIPKDRYAGVCCVEFPIDVSKIAYRHTFRICVYEEQGGPFLLAERDFHFYNLAFFGEDVERFKPFAGAILKTGSSTCYKAVASAFPDAFSARFFIAIPIEKALFRYPEMKIRIYFQNATDSVHFCKLEHLRDSLDGQSMIYAADAPFLVDMYRDGIGFVELFCLGTRLASFAFHIGSSDMEGVWRGKALVPMPFSSVMAAERFARSVNQPDDENPDEEQEAKAVEKEALFNELIDDFIHRQNDDNEAEDNYDDEDGGDENEEDEDEEDVDEDDEDVDEDDEDDVDEDEEDPEDMDFEKFTAERRLAEEQAAQVVLDQLTGLASVRKKIDDFSYAVMFNQKRGSLNLPTFSQPLHSMFLGSPGTGKTTVAKAIGQILRKAGVLSSGHVVCLERSQLLGPNYSNEETNTREAIDKAQGGILFIDEAYQLYQKDDPRDPGRLVIETLITALSDETRRDWMLILAGYPDEMKRMFDMNPGLRSRIPETNIYTFEDFTEAELLEIADGYFARNKFTLTPEAHEALARRIADDYAHKGKDFGNARYVVNLIQMEIVPTLSRRVVLAGVFNEETLSLILPCDIPPFVPKPRDNKSERPPIGFH